MLQSLFLAGVAALGMLGLSGALAAQGTIYEDTDWNTALIDGCGLPDAGSVAVINSGQDTKLQFTLAQGDKGRCSTDNRARHRAPYWERAELSQLGRMSLGSRHKISAEVTFVRGFTGEREAFFQIHGWASDCTHAYPPVMVKFHKGRLRVEALHSVSNGGSGKHRNVLRKRVKVAALYGRPLTLEVDFDTRTQPGVFSMSLNGQVLVSDAAVDFADCAVPYVKFGVYRPGGKGSETSVVVFDDVRVD